MSRTNPPAPTRGERLIEKGEASAIIHGHTVARSSDQPANIVRVFKHNPNGAFAMWNPNVCCACYCGTP